MAGVYDGVHQTPDYQDEGIMFLSVENIATMTSEKYISEEAYERDYKVRPEKGDILMTRIGDVGTPNVVETDEKLAYYVSLALLKPKGIDSYFLNNAIQSSAFQHGLRERTLLTAIPMKINKDEIGKVDISFPTDVNEQRKIGESFKQLDNLITLQQCKAQKKNPAQSSGFSLETPYSTAYSSTFLTLGGVAVFLSSHGNVAFINTQNSIKTIITRITPFTMILTTLFPI